MLFAQTNCTKACLIVKKVLPLYCSRDDYARYSLG